MKDVKGVVIYHKHCNDGLIAGIVAFNHLVDRGVTEIECHAANYGEGVPDIDVKGKLVYIVDFSYPPEELRQLSVGALHVVVCDHHLAAVEQFSTGESFLKSFNDGTTINLKFEDNIELIFAKNKSGAFLIREEAGQMLHRGYDIVDLVNDRDLWTFAYGEDSKMAHLGINMDKSEGVLCLPRFNTNADQITLNSPKYYIEKGRPLREYELALCAEITNQGTEFEIEFEGETHIIAVFNCPGSLASEASDYVMTSKRPDLVLSWFMTSSLDAIPRIKMSFRSSGNSQGMAKKLAMMFDGNGHPNAAGAKSNLVDLNEFIEERLVHAAPGNPW